MNAMLVRAKHPQVPTVSTMIRFEYGGRTYFLSGYSVPIINRCAFGPEDAIEVKCEIRHVLITQDVMLAVASRVEADARYERAVPQFIHANAEWFRSPMPEAIPGENAPDIDPTLGERGFGT